MRNAKRHGLVVGVEEQQKICVLGTLSLAIANLRRQTIDEHAESAHPAAVLPILGHHPLAVRSEPDDVLVPVPGLGIAIEEGIAMEIRMLLAVADHALREFQKRRARRVQVPVIPRQLGVLTVAIVVAALSAAQLVAAGNHG